ncbi:hypothetical protein QZH41_013372 [Actinostola sp. cb2023]|nr:hypothetical protein QZH41_013372 [Actinostola sp. cb2023]
MAASTSESSSKPKTSISLTEDDIPGAKIDRKSIDQCSVVQLKRWLLCRGAKTSGKKCSLVNRVKDYIKNGLDHKYLRDPDGGINVLRKKAEIGVFEHKYPELTEIFHKEVFKSNLMGIPKVSFATIWRYMIDGVDSKKKRSTTKPLVMGYNFFKSGHVLFVCHLHENGKHYLKSPYTPVI